MNHPRSEAWAAARRGEPTARQAEVLAFVKAAMRRNGAPPTIREVMAAFGFAGPNGARVHLSALVRKGLLTRPEGGRSRSSVPVAADGACPCCGRPMAGEESR